MIIQCTKSRSNAREEITKLCCIRCKVAEGSNADHAMWIDSEQIILIWRQVDCLDNADGKVVGKVSEPRQVSDELDTLSTTAILGCMTILIPISRISNAHNLSDNTTFELEKESNNEIDDAAENLIITYAHVDECDVTQELSP